MTTMLLNFRNWLPEVFSNRNFLNRDVIAGITLATILIPQSMAYAMLAGVDPKYGLYAAFIPVAIASFFGSSRYLATGPVAMVSLLTAVAAGSLAGGESSLYIFYAVLLAFSVGIFQIILSLTKAGKFFDKIPRHVIIGFTSAAALIIGGSQFHKTIGLPTIDLHDLQGLMNTSVNSTNGFAILISILAVLVIYLMKNKSNNAFVNNFAVLTAVIVSIVGSIIFSYQGPIVGYIPDGLPSLGMPSFDSAAISIPMFLIHTIIITFVGFMEALAIAQTLAIKMAVRETQELASKSASRFDVDQELFGQGLANIGSGFSGSYPVSGSFSRSSVCIVANGFSGLTSMITSLVVGLTLLFLTGTLFYLPHATLGIIIILAVIPLIEIKKMVEIFKENIKDGIIVWGTFFSTLLFPLLQIEVYEGVTTHIWTGIIFGFVLSFILERLMRN